MRLTLRTLLGWIDGVLPPADHALIGERVAGSRVATRLADRIGTAIGRPGIGVPICGGHWIADDPNFVAEYLDNTLSAVHLKAFERVCIESEVHLAEVGACHGMLADLVRDRAGEKALKAENHAGLKDRTQRLLMWTRVQKAGEGVAAAGARGRVTAARESQETARALVEALVSNAAPNDSTPKPVAASAAWQSGVVSDTIARGLRGGESAAAAAVEPATFEPEPEPAAAVMPAREGVRGSFVAWMTAGFAFTLLLALAGALVSSMNTSRAFEPEAGCFRCTDP